jgi:hypothetical protein
MRSVSPYPACARERPEVTGRRPRETGARPGSVCKARRASKCSVLELSPRHGQGERGAERRNRAKYREDRTECRVDMRGAVMAARTLAFSALTKATLSSGRRSSA